MNEFELKVFKNEWDKLNIINILNIKDRKYPGETTVSVIYKYRDYVCVAAFLNIKKHNTGYEEKVKMVKQLMKDNNEYVDVVLYGEEKDNYLKSHALEDNMFVFVDGLIDNLGALEFMPKAKDGYENNLGKQIDKLILKDNLTGPQAYKEILKKYKIDIEKIEEFAKNERNEEGKRGL